MNQTTTSALRLNCRQFAITVGAMSLGFGWSGSARANGPVRLILPVSAGFGVVAIARAAGSRLGVALCAPVVIENLPSAGDVVGTQALVKSALDGQTLSLVSNNHVIYPAVIKSLSFDPIADITPISIVATSPLVIVTRPGFPARNLAEFRDQLQANPCKFNFGSPHNGTLLHLAAELFKDVTGLFPNHIPYSDTGSLVNDLMGEQVDWVVIALPAIRGTDRGWSPADFGRGNFAAGSRLVAIAHCGAARLRQVLCGRLGSRCGAQGHVPLTCGEHARRHRHGFQHKRNQGCHSQAGQHTRAAITRHRCCSFQGGAGTLRSAGEEVPHGGPVRRSP